MAPRKPRRSRAQRDPTAQEIALGTGPDANADAPDADPLDIDQDVEATGERAPHEVAFSEAELATLSEELCGEIETETALRTGREEDWMRYQRLYDSEPRTREKTYPMDGASNIVVPLAAIYADTVVARIMQAVFTVEPHWTATKLNAKYADAAKPLERWLDWARKNVWNQEDVVEPLVQETVKLGTSCLYVGWASETRMRYDDRTRTTAPTSRRYGPAPEWVSIADTLIPQGYTDVQTSPYFGHRVWLSGDRLRQLAYSNYIEGVDAVLRAQPDDETDLRKARRKADGADLARSDRYGVFALWNLWFSRDFDGDGWPEEYVAMLHADSRTVLRLKPNPYPSQMRPYVITRYLMREGEFYGLGIPERVEQLQDEASTIHNQRRDRAHLSNIVMYIGSAASNLPDSIRPKSGKVIKALSVNDLKEFRPASNVQVDAFEEQFVTMLADRAVGISELSEGKVTSPVGRAAATTIVSMMQEGARRFDRVIAKFRSSLSEQAHQIAESYQTFGLPAPDDVGAPEQVLDPEDAQQVRALLGAEDDLRAFLAIELAVSTQAVNREVEKQSNTQLYGMVIQYVMQVLQIATGIVNPQMPQPLRDIIVRLLQGVDKAMERIFESHQAFDLDQMLVADALAGMAQQMAQVMAAPPGAGAPGANGAAPGAPMPMLPAPNAAPPQEVQ